MCIESELTKKYQVKREKNIKLKSHLAFLSLPLIVSFVSFDMEREKEIETHNAEKAPETDNSTEIDFSCHSSTDRL